MASAMPEAQRMTADEFLELPERHDARGLELVDGEIVVNQPTWLHGTTFTRLLLAVGNWAAAGEARGRVSPAVEVLLDDRNVFAPDLLWYAHGHAPALHDPPPYGLPALAMEIRSPSTWAYDVGAKKSSYERHGLRELWLVDTTADGVLIFRRSEPEASSFDVALELGQADILSSPLLPDFALPLGELFAADS